MFRHDYPYTDFHEMNLDWFLSKFSSLLAEWEKMQINFDDLESAFNALKEYVNNYFDNLDVQEEINNKLDDMMENGELAAILERLMPKHVGRVIYFYVDNINGDNRNSGLTADDPVHDFEYALHMLNQGYTNLGIYLMNSDIYTIPSDIYVINGCTLHLRNYNDSDCIIRSESGSFISYSSHLSFYGTDGHPMIFDINTIRIDGGEFWGEYLDFETGFISNGCGARLRWCIYRKLTQFTHANVVLEGVEIYANNTDNTYISITAGCIYLRLYVSAHTEGVALPSNSKVFAVYGGWMGISSDVNFSEITNKFDYFVRTYAGMVASRNPERTGVLNLATADTAASGSPWASEIVIELADYDTGAISMYNRIGVIGDSFACGSIYDSTGVNQGRLVKLSWIANLARRNGCDYECYAFSGATTKSWLSNETYGLPAYQNAMGRCGLYFLALGINDSGISNYMGTIEDLHTDADTFYGNYSRIIDAILAKEPNALLVMLGCGRTSAARYDPYTEAISNIAASYNIPFINQYDDYYIKSNKYTNEMYSNHPTAQGCASLSRAIERLYNIASYQYRTYFKNYLGTDW